MHCNCGLESLDSLGLETYFISPKWYTQPHLHLPPTFNPKDDDVEAEYPLLPWVLFGCPHNWPPGVSVQWPVTLRARVQGLWTRAYKHHILIRIYSFKPQTELEKRGRRRNTQDLLSSRISLYSDFGLPTKVLDSHRTFQKEEEIWQLLGRCQAIKINRGQNVKKWGRERRVSNGDNYGGTFCWKPDSCTAVTCVLPNRFLRCLRYF